MKNIVLFVVMLILGFGLVGCGKAAEATSSSEEIVEEIPTENETPEEETPEEETPEEETSIDYVELSSLVMNDTINYRSTTIKITG